MRSCVGEFVVGVLVSVLMRLHATNRCPGSFLAAAVNVGLDARSTPAASGISCGGGSLPSSRDPVTSCFLGSKLGAIADGCCVVLR